MSVAEFITAFYPLLPHNLMGHHYKFRPSYMHLRNVKVLPCDYGSICRKKKTITEFFVEIIVPLIILK